MTENLAAPPLVALHGAPKRRSAAVHLNVCASEGQRFASRIQVQPALIELAAAVGSATMGSQPEAFVPSASACKVAPYVLGTDFKAGQTKAKTAIVEYLRALGLSPRTIASYNHLGNNDMKNLLSPRTWKAKERVKTDVFGPWNEEAIDDGRGPSA